MIDKWFVNLSNVNIPTYVFNLLQLGNKFNLLVDVNKKPTVHEFIKDIESNIKRLDRELNMKNTIPQFHKFLHSKTHENIWNNRILDMTKKLHYFATKILISFSSAQIKEM